MGKNKSAEEHLKEIDEKLKKQNKRVKKGIVNALDQGNFPFQRKK
jgi:hypothetical protein